jgi:phenylalanyl-tRNA synthetase beta chain
MKFSLLWLKDYLDLNQQEVGRIPEVLLKMGVEVDEIEDVPNGFIVTTIQKIEKHPNADRLNLCHIDAQERPVVCGAANVREGMQCIFAQLGAVIPGSNLVLKPKIIRGIESHGMLCSGAELGITGDGEGIYEVPDGRTVADIMLPHGQIYTVSITPNRGDLMSVYGLARELASFGIGELKKPNKYSLAINYITPSDDSDNSIIVSSDDVLSMYSVCIENIQDNITPDWLKNRLISVGISTHNLVVDVTNYIAHTLGQPLHAFDNQLVRKIIVKKVDSIKFVDLKQKEHDIHNMTVMISNGQCVSLPGVIGGYYGRCSNSSTHVLLEAGNYTREHIYHGQMVAKTHASKLFFHQIDPVMTKLALTEAVALIQSIVGCSFHSAYKAKEYKINQTLIHSDIPEGHGALKKLGFNQQGESWIVPTWRHDILSNEDLVEEYYRMIGYDSIKSEPFIPLKQFYQEGHNYNYEYIKNALSNTGFYEVVTLDFMSLFMHEIDPQVSELIILNKISDSFYCLRNSIIANLIETYATYMRYGWQCPGIFEIGHVFQKDKVERHVGLVLNNSNTWFNPDTKFKYLEMKRHLEQIIHTVFTNSYLETKHGAHPLLDHVCEWHLNGSIVARFGVLKPIHMKKLKIKKPMYIGSIVLDYASNQDIQVKITNQGVVTRDISIGIPSGMYVGDLVHKIHMINENAVIRVFDLHPNMQLNNFDRALGIRVILNQLEHSITNEEVHNIINRIQEKIVHLGCTIR